MLFLEVHMAYKVLVRVGGFQFIDCCFLRLLGIETPLGGKRLFQFIDGCFRKRYLIDDVVAYTMFQFIDCCFSTFAIAVMFP